MADLLRTDYKDDVLNAEVNTRRKYQMITNDDGTISFVDVTDYSQVGDSFGGAVINAQNEALANQSNQITELNNALEETSNAIGTCQLVLEGTTGKWASRNIASYRGAYIVWLSDSGIMIAETYVPLDILNLAKNSLSYPTTIYHNGILIGQWAYNKINDIAVYPFDGHKVQVYGIN